MLKVLETYQAAQERQQWPQDPIAGAILQGIKKANDKYRAWSNGFWLSDAGVENVMQTYVAEACFKAVKDEGLHVHPEASLPYFFGKADAARNRLDVAVTGEDEIPLYVIELKRGLSGEWRDTDKFNQLLIRWRTPSKNGLRSAYWGQFIPWRYSTRYPTLESRVEAAIEKFKSQINLSRLDIVWNEMFLGKGYWPNDAGDQVEWRAAALVATITKKP
jgi:hypothetical protein